MGYRRRIGFGKRFIEAREDPAWYNQGHPGICYNSTLSQLLYGSLLIGATGVGGKVDL